MGIIHFAPIGTSPGAVTAALAYLKQERNNLAGFKGQVIESVVLFASPEVRSGQIRAEECIYNDYMSMSSHGRPWKNRNVVDAVTEFIQKEIAPVMPKGGAVHCCQVDPNDFDACFRIVARTALHFSPHTDVGHNIWANLTGGTNVLNGALLQVAFLSALIAQLYYTFLADEEHRKYLQPPSKDPTKFHWYQVPLIKTSFDDSYYQVLKSLPQDDWCDGDELLSRLKHTHYFSSMNIQTFRQQFLNKMDGRELERESLPGGLEGNCVRISSYGKSILSMIDDVLFQALVHRGKGEEIDISSLTQDLQLEKL